MGRLDLPDKVRDEDRDDYAAEEVFALSTGELLGRLWWLACTALILVAIGLMAWDRLSHLSAFTIAPTLILWGMSLGSRFGIK